jgi:hypothetical protein
MTVEFNLEKRLEIIDGFDDIEVLRGYTKMLAEVWEATKNTNKGLKEAIDAYKLQAEIQATTIQIMEKSDKLSQQMIDSLKEICRVYGVEV